LHDARFGVTCALGRIALKDFRAVLVTLDEDSELLDILQLVAAGLSVFKLAHDICVSISEEDFFTVLVLGEDLNVNARKRLARLRASNFELTKCL
jgi:hypothetical protein